MAVPGSCHALASPSTCHCSKQSYALTPQRTACIPCASDCLECVFVSPGRTRCTECYTLTLINGECRRCDDPRCADCSADFRLCKACRNKAHVVNSATGRCQDPSWPAPCPQQAGGPGRRGGCAAPPRPNPKTAQSGRWACGGRQNVHASCRGAEVLSRCLWMPQHAAPGQPHTH